MLHIIIEFLAKISGNLAGKFISDRFGTIRINLAKQKPTIKPFSVAGTWTNTLEGTTEKAECVMNLAQKGTSLTGTLTINSKRKIKRKWVETEPFDCRMTGENIDGKVILQGLPAGNHYSAFNCGIFLITEGGNRLEGSAIRLHNIDSSVFIDPKVSWNKKVEK